MNHSALKKFAIKARNDLMEQVGARLTYVITSDSVELRERESQVKELRTALRKESEEALIERVAYTWFNRFAALRFMDARGYHPFGCRVVTASPGNTQPEILQLARNGVINEDFELDRQRVNDLLDGRVPSSNAQAEVYKILVVAACNFYHRLMPFVFEKIADYTELLLPDDLLSETSVANGFRTAIADEDCTEVEILGWLYQYYISEKKDEVFAGLKKKKKITPENIPAATQLFTPHWIVRYMVENSLGRLWMQNRPQSRLRERMDYYIEDPEGQQNKDFFRIQSVEEIKLIDPACGSGHILTYAFDLLYAIYEEEGYEPSRIPGHILTKNLYGIEIDERAAGLSYLALIMKAQERYPRFLRRQANEARHERIEPKICCLEEIHFEEGELARYMETLNIKKLFTAPVLTLMHKFEEAKNFGSLIKPVIDDVSFLREAIEDKDLGGDLFLRESHRKVLTVLRQTEFLGQRYHCVVANPPYMGSKGMNGRLGAWAKDYYPDSKSDLFGMFIERNLDLAQELGFVALITMQSWMFLSSFEKLRNKLLGKDTILSMAHLGARAFDSIGGEVVSTTAFVLGNYNRPNYKSGYLRLIDGNSEAEKESAIHEAIKNPDCGWFYRAAAADFKKIPGSSIAYWVSEGLKHAFEHGSPLRRIAIPRQGLATMDNARFTRIWHEVSADNSSLFSENLRCKWYPYNKGGDYRKWYGNQEILVNWKNSGEEIKQLSISRYGSASKRVVNEESYFSPSVTWSKIGSITPSFRFQPKGAVFDVAGMSLFPNESQFAILLMLLNSKLVIQVLRLLSPTLNFEAGQIGAIPVIKPQGLDSSIFDKLVTGAKTDWDSFETSWDFTNVPLLHPNYHLSTLESTYNQLSTQWCEMTLEMQRLEEENNRIFIETYGLQDELTPEVPLNEITLTCNPHYRYGGKKSDKKLGALLLVDTMKEFISYAVGCMFGRYSLDRQGLILANQGETIKDYLNQIPEPTFPADEDNVIPILDGNWFTDDITDRFFKFLRITFGQEHFEENLKFVVQAIGKDIRKYFLKNFYSDHWKRYKKRPVYWLFSSPKGSFNALIYMHRYNRNTVNLLLNNYLREFQNKLQNRRAHLNEILASESTSARDKTAATKEQTKIERSLTELADWERDVIYPLATQRLEIDLDDGVKQNYPKFGKALAKIPGLSE